MLSIKEQKIVILTFQIVNNSYFAINLLQLFPANIMLLMLRIKEQKTVILTSDNYRDGFNP